jgi:uncharacterized protein (UPF0261 family)
MLVRFVEEFGRPTVLVIGTWDSKGEVLAELANLLEASGASHLQINIGPLERLPEYKIDYDTSVFVEAAGKSISEVRAQNRATAVATIKKGIISAMEKDKLKFKNAKPELQLEGIIGVGGTNGTELVTSFLREYPDVPSICVSTVAQHENHHYTLHHGNIYLINSVTDIGSNLNSTLQGIITEAVGALLGRIMARRYLKKPHQIKAKIAVSQFGTTTPCVERCSTLLRAEGYEISPFHMVGSGGKNMEALIAKGEFQALLEITPTELADLYGMGVYSAGPSRLSAAIKMKIPQVFVPGCLDMINLGNYEDVIKDPRFNGRTLYQCTEGVTVMRPTLKELRRISQHIVDNFRQAESVVKVLLPLKGISMFDDPANKSFLWYDSYADKFLFAELKRLLKLYCKDIEVVEVDYHINDPKFAEIATSLLLKAMAENKNYSRQSRVDQSKNVTKFFSLDTQEIQSTSQHQSRVERSCTF